MHASRFDEDTGLLKSGLLSADEKRTWNKRKDTSGLSAASKRAALNAPAGSKTAQGGIVRPRINEVLEPSAAVNLCAVPDDVALVAAVASAHTPGAHNHLICAADLEGELGAVTASDSVSSSDGKLPQPTPMSRRACCGKKPRPLNSTTTNGSPPTTIVSAARARWRRVRVAACVEIDQCERCATFDFCTGRCREGRQEAAQLGVREVVPRARRCDSGAQRGLELSKRAPRHVRRPIPAGGVRGPPHAEFPGRGACRRAFRHAFRPGAFGSREPAQGQQVVERALRGRALRVDAARPRA